MKTRLKFCCGCTPLGDAVPLFCSALTGCLGIGYPYARIDCRDFAAIADMRIHLDPSPRE